MRQTAGPRQDNALCNQSLRQHTAKSKTAAFWVLNIALIGLRPAPSEALGHWKEFLPTVMNKTDIQIFQPGVYAMADRVLGLLHTFFRIWFRVNDVRFRESLQKVIIRFVMS